MTEETSKLAGTIVSRAMLDQSEKAMEDILAAFELMAERMMTGEDDMSMGELSKARIALGQTRSQLIDEVNKHEKRVLLSKGLLAEAPLDFDSIRAEIGSKLDRLRRAQISGHVVHMSQEIHPRLLEQFLGDLVRVGLRVILRVLLAADHDARCHYDCEEWRP